MPRDLATATAAAVQADRGHAHVYLAELYFDSKVASSRIQWATLPSGAPALAVIVLVSLDGGRNWYDVPTNGGEIPGIVVGDTLHGRSLTVRVLFDKTVADAHLDWIEAEVTYDTGETTLKRWDTQAEWEEGSFNGAEANNDGTLSIEPQIALGFTGSGGYVRIPGDLDSPINLSRGGYGVLVTSSNFGDVHVEFVASNPTQRDIDIRDFTIECRFVVDDAGPQQTIYQWFDDSGQIEACRLLVEGGKITFVGLVIPLTFPNGRILLDYTNYTTPVIGNLAGRPIDVAVIYDGFIVSVWVDGQQLAVGRIIAQDDEFGRGGDAFIPVMSGDLYVGRSPKGQSPLTGAVHELRLWNSRLTPGDITKRLGRRLTQSEASALFATGDLVASYIFADGSGDTVTDIAGANDGVLVQPADKEDGVRWIVSDPPDGDFVEIDTTIGARDDVVLVGRSLRRLPSWTSQEIDLAVYGNAVYVNTAPFPIQYADKTYLGVGRLGGIGAIEETTQVESRSLQLTLSGVQPEHISIALQTPYRDRPCVVLLAVYGADGLLKGEPAILFEGIMDTMPITVGEEATVGVTCESHLVRWEEARPRRWTAASQRDLYADDAGFDELAATAERTIWWPAKFTQEQG